MSDELVDACGLLHIASYGNFIVRPLPPTDNRAFCEHRWWLKAIVAFARKRDGWDNDSWIPKMYHVVRSSLNRWSYIYCILFDASWPEMPAVLSGAARNQKDKPVASELEFEITSKQVIAVLVSRISCSKHLIGKGNIAQLHVRAKTALALRDFIDALTEDNPLQSCGAFCTSKLHGDFFGTEKTYVCIKGERRGTWAPGPGHGELFILAMRC